MSWTFAVMLMLLWGVGLIASYTMGGFIHVLIALAVVVAFFKVMQGHKVLARNRWQRGPLHLVNERLQS